MAIIFLNTYFLEDLWDIVYLSQSDSGDFNSKGLSHKKATWLSLPKQLLRIMLVCTEAWLLYLSLV